MSGAGTMDGERIRAAAAEIAAGGPSVPIAGRDPVNRPMIHNWVEAMGDANPIYVDDEAARAAGHPGVVAPPAMAQVWTMRGLGGVRTDDDPLGRASALFDEAGYTSVVATNCDTVYHRYLEPGEEVTLSAELIDVTGPKQTALGEGWFFTTRNTWRTGDEVVAEMEFRILKFRPGSRYADSPSGSSATRSPNGAASDAAGGARSPSGVRADVVGGARSSDGAGADVIDGGRVAGERSEPAYRDHGDLDPARLIRPSVSRDTAFFWEGIAAHELRIQRLPDGALRHPPIPATWKPRNTDGSCPVTDYEVAAGTGTVYSFVVHHAPKVPGRQVPFVVALVELDEGVRMLGELRGVDPDRVRIGLPVEVEFLDFPAGEDSDAWTLYAWRPR